MSLHKKIIYQLLNTQQYQLEIRTNKNYEEFILRPTSSHQKILLFSIFLSLCPTIAYFSAIASGLSLIFLSMIFVLLLIQLRKIKYLYEYSGAAYNDLKFNATHLQISAIKRWLIPIGIGIFSLSVTTFKEFNLSAQSDFIFCMEIFKEYTVFLIYVLTILIPYCLIQIIIKMTSWNLVSKFKDFYTFSASDTSKLIIKEACMNFNSKHQYNDVQKLIVSIAKNMRYISFNEKNGNADVNFAGLFTYFSPISLPFIILMLMPFTNYMASPNTLNIFFDKPALALSIVCWGTWSLTYYTHCIKFDLSHTIDQINSNHLNARVLYEQIKLYFKNYYSKQLQYLNGKPTEKVFQIVITLLIPAYMGYIDLFEIAKKTDNTLQCVKMHQLKLDKNI